MISKIVFCLVLFVLTIWSIRGVSAGSHFCEALEANQNQIDYTLNQPLWNTKGFYNYISIRGFVWTIVYKPKGRKKRQDPEAKEGPELNASPDKKAPKDDGKDVSLQNEIGDKMVDGTHFFDMSYKCAFGIRYKGRKDRTVIGGLSLDYEKIIWINIKPKGSRSKRQSNNGTESETVAPESVGSTPDPKWIYSFKTGFNEINYKPQVAFNSMSNIDNSFVNFIETIPGTETDPYRSLIQTFSIKSPASSAWVNETDKDPKNVPLAIKNVASKYLIKGVFPIQMSGSIDGSIILLEICSSNDIPCTGTITYEYCVSAEKESDVTSDGKPCHRKNLKPLYDCNNWKSNAGRLDVETTQTPPPEVESIAEPEIPQPPQAVDDKTNTTITPSPSEEPKSLLWLWILIIVIIIIIILLILLCLFCCGKKEKKASEEPVAEGAPPKADGGPSSGTTLNTQSATSTMSARSGNVEGAGGGGGGGGLGGGKPSAVSGVTSTMSTASARSKVVNSSVGQTPGSLKASSKGANSKVSPNMPSSLSTASARSKANT